jgi:hypothetical protein
VSRESATGAGTAVVDEGATGEVAGESTLKKSADGSKNGNGSKNRTGSKNGSGSKNGNGSKKSGNGKSKPAT